MSHLFRIFCQDVTSVRRFGICDDLALQKQRAYITDSHGAKWTATVNNHHGKEVVFTALDHCIEFNKQPTGRKESRCEGVLTWENTIAFLEMKERTGDTKSCIDGADKQLRNSIRIVSEKVNLSTFTDKRAYICNPNRKKLNTSNRAWAKQFQEETGYNLRVSNWIEID